MWEGFIAILQKGLPLMLVVTSSVAPMTLTQQPAPSCCWAAYVRRGICVARVLACRALTCRSLTLQCNFFPLLQALYPATWTEHFGLQHHP